MAREFEIRREVLLPATPEQVFEAVTTGTGGWLFPVADEAGAAPGPQAPGVTAWEPPGRFAVRTEGEGGRFDTLEYLIEPRGEGGARLRYTHGGSFAEDYDTRCESCEKHTDFHLHTLGQYLRHFAGRPAVFVDVQGPAASAGADGFELLLDELHLDQEVRVGDRLSLDLPEIGVLDAEVDYRTPQFLGLRAQDGLYRFFGRNAFGAPVGVTLHLFGEDADRTSTGQPWQAWLDGLYAG
ncbi:SRPBCC domain-containing protein [Kitasatospora herbaricolor]|uniref:SRPBCC domain-containing protein n=1 Tax=Kitasatospora herbaricolor TaxID=68217 RepID=A0ABZ1WGM9_9ACTN|nr:SRPBCC domain-containing protein [Kitasatospora herbaricolor]